MDYKVKDRSAKVAKKRDWKADNRRSIQLQMASIAKAARKSAERRGLAVDGYTPTVRGWKNG